MRLHYGRSLLLCCLSIFARPSAARRPIFHGDEEKTNGSSTSRGLQPRVIGGENAKLGEFPYFVDMGKCGGVLIAPGIVLSAAHCMKYMLPGVYVTIGPRVVKDLGSPRVKIVERQYHPWYEESYDMILLRLEEPIYFDDSSKVELVVNEDHDFPPDGSDLTAVGFGSLKEETNLFPKILQKVEVQAVNLQDCNETIEGEVFDDAYLCAGTEEGGKDTCLGDSGGPLVYIDGMQHTLVGLSSWGYGCGRIGTPGIYARVSMGMDWISTVVCDCWKVEGASFCNDPNNNNNNTSTSQLTNDGVAAEESWTFECPYFPSLHCADEPGYVDEKGYTCARYEELHNPGCPYYGGWRGGPGFEDTNSSASCCWCGGGTESDPPPVTDFERDPKCEDVPGYADRYGDDCAWYEANTGPGCGGWGTITGGSMYRDLTPDGACCHCGGGIHPTPAPSAMPTRMQSSTPTIVPTTISLAQTPSVLSGSPTIAAPAVDGIDDPNKDGADTADTTTGESGNSTDGSTDSGASGIGSWTSTVAILAMIQLLLLF